MEYKQYISSPQKIKKINEQFKSYYYGTSFDYCLIRVSGFCRTHQTIKCTGEYQRVFHVICSDIINTKFINNPKVNDLSYMETYPSVEKIKLSNTTWLCANYKHK